jgi:hypothetical protein
MNAIHDPKLTVAANDRSLRDEAAIEPDAPATGEVKKETQIIAIYGKGGIGKSFTLANLSPHDGPAGQEGSAHRLRSQERHDIACSSAAAHARPSSRRRPRRSSPAMK